LAYALQGAAGAGAVNAGFGVQGAGAPED